MHISPGPVFFYRRLAALSMQLAGRGLCWKQMLVRRGVIMKIPRELQIPAIVFSLEAVFIIGLSLIFLVLAPR